MTVALQMGIKGGERLQAVPLCEFAYFPCGVFKEREMWIRTDLSDSEKYVFTYSTDAY